MLKTILRKRLYPVIIYSIIIIDFLPVRAAENISSIIEKNLDLKSRDIAYIRFRK